MQSELTACAASSHRTCADQSEQTRVTPRDARAPRARGGGGGGETGGARARARARAHLEADVTAGHLVSTHFRLTAQAPRRVRGEAFLRAAEERAGSTLLEEHVNTLKNRVVLPLLEHRDQGRGPVREKREDDDGGEHAQCHRVLAAERGHRRDEDEDEQAHERAHDQPDALLSREVAPRARLHFARALRDLAPDDRDVEHWEGGEGARRARSGPVLTRAGARGVARRHALMSTPNMTYIESAVSVIT